MSQGAKSRRTIGIISNGGPANDGFSFKGGQKSTRLPLDSQRAQTEQQIKFQDIQGMTRTANGSQINFANGGGFDSTDQ